MRNKNCFFIYLYIVYIGVEDIWIFAPSDVQQMLFPCLSMSIVYIVGEATRALAPSDVQQKVLRYLCLLYTRG
jgi:hypothetical protein